MPLLLLRYLPQIVGIGLIIGILGYVGYSLHNNGRHVERVIWLQKESDRKNAESILINQARELAKAEALKQYNGLIEVINEQAKLNDKLNNDIANLDGKRMFVNTRQAKCDGSGMSSKANNTSGISAELGGENFSELSGTFGKQVQDDYIGAAELVRDCKLTLMLVKQNFEIVD